jgi:hypothetical protein
MKDRELSMKFFEIAERTVTMQLDPEDSELITRACPYEPIDCSGRASGERRSNTAIHT